MDYHAKLFCFLFFLKSLVGAIPTGTEIQKISKEKKGIKRHTWPVNRFLYFPWSILYHQSGVWSLRELQILRNRHFRSFEGESLHYKNSTEQIKTRQFLAKVLEEQVEYFKLMLI